MKILLAVDGSDYTVRAANFLIKHFDWFRAPPELHLLHVKLPIPKGLAATQAASILGSDAIADYYREESQAALAHAEKILREAGVAYTARYEVGGIADRICAYAGDHAMDLIVMGSHGHGAFANLVMGSVATKVLAAKSRVPVLIVR